MYKKLLLALLITGSAQAHIYFDYEPELSALVDLGKEAAVTDLIKVHNHALKWIYDIIEDHVEGRHKLTRQETAYLEYISNMLADVSNQIGYFPRTMDF